VTHASAELRDYYAARAPYFDAVYLKPERREDVAFLTAHFPARLAGRNVLEVACGTGYWTQHIAPAALRVVATDAVGEPLEFARQRPGTANVAFLQADAYALREELGLFDAAFAGLWLSHVPIGARRAFLGSLHARLEPGARVLFFDNGLGQLRDFPITETDAEGNTYQRRTLRDGATHRVLKNFPSEAELRALLEPFATRIEFRELQNYWLLEYDFSPAQPRS
jgi:demethylmenaquinone methyltransferase/2-methoxy-6-polyprenyl-1,4-benzoquinol methylase